MLTPKRHLSIYVGLLLDVLRHRSQNLRGGSQNIWRISQNIWAPGCKKLNLFGPSGSQENLDFQTVQETLGPRGSPSTFKSGGRFAYGCIQCHMQICIKISCCSPCYASSSPSPFIPCLRGFVPSVSLHAFANLIMVGK